MATVLTKMKYCLKYGHTFFICQYFGLVLMIMLNIMYCMQKGELQNERQPGNLLCLNIIN